ncbi:protein lifeguard 2-like [Sinocyclocheilus anshuiensis]|uniref:protein lifeguard 2-like n=1 Tax=Sinocyclocheilus anshuiensis TaxID=1608454 RepID=UPI0007BA4191|nr:PREDICTED: protein lifeguard 2-like [Sinocyclocheilus anshuiensis]
MPPSYEEANAGCPGYYYGEGTFSWDDMYIRRVFIRKVYSILMLQLFSTVAVIALFTFCAPVRMYIQTHPVLYSWSNLLFLVTYISLACCGDLRRQFPWNLILFTIFCGLPLAFCLVSYVMLCYAVVPVSPVFPSWMIKDSRFELTPTSPRSSSRQIVTISCGLL